MQPQVVEAGLRGLIGNAGEYLVVGELLKRGVVASPAPRNTPAFDVLITSPDGKRSANIRVKSLSPSARNWVWNDRNAKKRDIRSAEDLRSEDINIFPHLSEQGDFTVLVDLNAEQLPAIFFITETKELNERVVQRFLDWFKKESKTKKPRDLHNPMFRWGDFEGEKTWLAGKRNNWTPVKKYLGVS